MATLMLKAIPEAQRDEVVAMSDCQFLPFGTSPHFLLSRWSQREADAPAES